MASLSRSGTATHFRLPWIIVLVVLVAYHNSLNGAFLFDDYSCIVDNLQLRSVWTSWRAPAPDVALAGRPVAAITFGLNYAIHGLDVRGYHLVNLLLHLCNALLLWGIVRRTLRSARLRHLSEAESYGLATAVAWLWAVHPLLTESVDYLVQRTELLVAACLLGMLYAVIRAATSARPGRWAGAAIGCGLLGAGSKELIVVAPLIVLLYDRVFLSGSWRAALRLRRGLYLGLTLTWAIVALLALTGPRLRTVGFQQSHMAPWAYALTQCGVILHYLRLALWPSPLVVDYADWPIAARLAEVWLQAAFIGGLLGITVWALRRRPMLGFLGAWVWIILAPTSSVIPIITEVAAERRMYLPLAGLVTLGVVAGWRLLSRSIWRPTIQQALGVAMVLGLSSVYLTLTLQRHVVYRSERTMLEDVIAKRPGNERAYYNLGLALVEAGEDEAAIERLQQAVHISPADAWAHNNLGVLLARRHHWDEAAAHYTEAIRLNPWLTEPRDNLQQLLAMQGPPPESR